MRRSFQLFVFGIAALAAVVLSQLSWPELLTLAPREVLGLLAFIVLGAVAEAVALNSAAVTDRAEKMKTSLAFLPLMACAVVFPPAAAVLAAVLVLLFTEVALRARLVWRGVFNVSQTVIAVGSAVGVYQLIGGGSTPSFEVQAIAFFALACTFLGVNMVLVSLAFSIRERKAFHAVFRHTVGPGGGNFLYGFLASPIALAAGKIYQEFAEPGLLLVLLPLLLIRSSYLAQQKLQQANRDLLQVLVKAIETRDPYTSGHSVRVSILARTLAEDLGLPRRRVETIETAALLHDIGKIDRVYADLISKAANLSETERAVIRTHATKGADLLESLSSLDRDVILAVRHHHERFDGKGYPAGLVGKATPVGARIIMLCDSIDAMLSDRPYRKALSIEAVKAELQRCAGTQFDPELVEVILQQGTLERAARLIPQKADPTPLHEPVHAASHGAIA